MKNFMWAFIFLFILSACDPVEPENITLNWTPEEQCQMWNKWSVKVTEVTPITFALDPMDPEYFQHPPILMIDNNTGEKTVGGICPDEVPGYGYYKF